MAKQTTKPTEAQKIAALAEALRVAMPLLAAAKHRGEPIPFDMAHAALTLARQ